MEPRVIPFRVGGPIQDPADFAGRREVLQKISNAMLNLQNISLRGERRTGKTSLLHYLAHPASCSVIGLPVTHITVYFDFQALTKASAASVWQAMADAVAEQIRQKSPDKKHESERFLATMAKFLASPEAPGLFGTGFGRALNHLDASGLKIHLLLDEFDQTARNPNLGDLFYDALRSLPTRADNVSYVIATRTGLAALQPTYDRVSSPLFNIFTSITLGPFQTDDVLHLIFDYFARGKLDMSLAERLCTESSFLYDITGYHPFFLQMLCYHLCARLDYPDWPLGQARHEALRAFEEDSEPHSEYYWQLSSEEEQGLMKKLAARQPIDWGQPRIVASIESLRDRCLVVQAGEAGREWRLFSSTFSDWVNVEQTKYIYDVFVSYSHTDQEWVRNELLPRLERAGLKVIIDYRDFEPGATLLTEMERAVLESRKIVMVLTPAYLGSQWTGFERTLAQVSDPGARHRRLLPVVLRQCAIPLELRNLVRVDLTPSQPHEAQFRRLLEAVATDVPTHLEADVPSSIHIPAGLFWMGSPLEDAEAHGNEKPRRKLDLRGYRISRYPVTNAQYACFVRDTGYRVPEHWGEGIVPAGLEDHPVMNVSHDDAEAYCRWLSQATGQHYRLPTEEEWEKAARGGLPETRRYPWGDEWQPDLCNTQEMGWNGTTPVHEFERTNKSPFGVVDIAGNVWEWTASSYEEYSGSPHRSLQYGPCYRVVRGGSWQNSQREARISCRGRYKPDVRRPYLGFRIVSD
jgi:formylglycine-generating enzyme required for sulfatase activity